jgi:hypothetical protein
MSLPNRLEKTSPSDSDNPSAGAAQIRNLKGFLEDLFGVLDTQTYTAKAMDVGLGGQVTVGQQRLLFQDGSATVPSFGFSGATGTGLAYDGATTAIAILRNGSKVGHLGIPQQPDMGGTGQDTSTWIGMTGVRSGTWYRQQGTILIPAPTGVAATDTAAIVAAIAALPSSKGVLLFQTGTYKINTSLDLTGLTGVVLQGLGYGTEIKLGTTGTPGIDLTNSTRMIFRDLLITSEEDTAAPNVMVLMARPASTASSGWHQFHNVQFEGPTTGTTFKAVLYNYAAELCEFYGCRCYARNPSSVGLYYTSTNDLSIASSYQTIAAGAQSCVTLLWMGGHIVDYSGLTGATAALPVYLHNCRDVTLSPQWMSTGGNQFIYALSDGPGTIIDVLNVQNVRCEVQPAGNPKYFIYGDATNLTLVIGNITGCMLACSDAVVKQAGGGSTVLYPGNIQGNNYALVPTKMIDTGGALLGGIVDANNLPITAYAIYGTIIHDLTANSDVVTTGDRRGTFLTNGLTNMEMSVNDSFIEGTERTDPDAPSSNRGRIYFKDNGAGKTQLVVRFPTGVVQQIAIEP